MLNVRLAGDHLYGKSAVHLAVACDVYDGVFFVLSFFPRGVLDEILNLIESVSEVFFFLLFNNFQAPRFSLDLLIRHRKSHKKITKTVSYSLLLADGIHPGEV